MCRRGFCMISIFQAIDDHQGYKMGRFSKAVAVVKDQTSVYMAKAGGNSPDLAELSVAILKATCHDDCPSEECYVQEILTLTNDSPSHVASCVTTISRRLSKTRNWIVALKTLMLVQRLLQEGNPAYENEIFNATRRGTRLLNMSDFRDALRSNTWDYAAFVRAYALFLDEKLECKMQGRKRPNGSFSVSHEETDEEEHKEPEPEPEHEHEAIVVPVHEMTNEQIFSHTNHMMQLLERFIACRPAGAARHHRMVMVALYPILTQSFQLYQDVNEILGVLENRFKDLSVQHSMKVYSIFRRVAKQYDELEMFYDWCKSVGVAKTSEYPEVVEKISQKKIDGMDEVIKDKSAAAK